VKWALLALAGCGRIGFDLRGDAESGVPDAPPPMLLAMAAPGYRSSTTVSASIHDTADTMLVAATYWDETPDAITLTDTAGLTWTSLPGMDMSMNLGSQCGGTTGNATGAQLWYAQVPADGSNTITVSQTPSNMEPLGIFLLAYSGLATTNVVDASAIQIAPAISNQMTAPALQTTQTDVIVAFFVDTTPVGNCGAGTGFTARAQDPPYLAMIEDSIGPAGIYAPTATLPSGTSDPCWIATAAAFKAR
jgi:hypothetical protein